MKYRPSDPFTDLFIIAALFLGAAVLTLAPMGGLN